MAETRQPKFGEAVVSWVTVWNELYPEESYDPHDDQHAFDIHRLRGLVMAQAAETEAVLGMILLALDPNQRIDRPGGHLLRSVRQRLSAQAKSAWPHSLDLIDKAIKRRNRVVHDSVQIGSTWLPYRTGDGGEWVPVISLMGGNECDENDLREDLALQQQATCEAVRILYALRTASG